MSQIPVLKSFDSSWALLRDPYRFISKNCKKVGADLFQTRVFLRKTVCMTGPEAAAFFYDKANFIRAGAMPEPVRATLLGKGGVQGLDGDMHLHRKAMFMSLMSPQGIQRMVDLTENQWRQSLENWIEEKKDVSLYQEILEILTRAACEWTGVPLAESEVRDRTEDIRSMFEDAGAADLRHFKSRLARKRSESWIRSLIEDIREGKCKPAPESPIYTVATFRDADGQALNTQVAAIEILNLIRPIVAVATYIVFIAHALHENPGWRSRLLLGDGQDLENFVQEVRRFYPFFPSVAAQARQDLTWKGMSIPEGTRVLLDLYGINQDPRSWSEPEKFQPERFESWDQSPFNFVPQGGGSHHLNHRCPGEWITLGLMKLAVHFFTGVFDYKVPRQETELDFSHLPALPRSRMILAGIQRRSEESRKNLNISKDPVIGVHKDQRDGKETQPRQ